MLYPDDLESNADWPKGTPDALADLDRAPDSAKVKRRPKSKRQAPAPGRGVNREK